MKILCLSNGTLDENLGSGYVILNFAKEMFKKGHKVTLLEPQDYGFWAKWRRGRQYGLAIGMAIQVITSIFRKKFDIIEVYGGEGWLAIWLVKRLLKVGPPIVSHSNGIESHVYVSEEFWRQKGIDWHPRSWFQINQARLFDIGFRNADALIVVSNYDKAFAQDRNYQPRERLICIENALPQTFLNRIYPKDRKKIILYCGAWIPRKNVKLLTEDIPRFLNDYPDWSFVIAGTQVTSIIKMSFPKDLQNRIKIIGQIQRDELLPLYESSTVLVLPSFYESFGLVAAEAMSRGCCTILSKVGFAAELKHKVETFLLDDITSPHLYYALAELAQDDELRSRLMINGAYRVQGLTWFKSGTMLCDFFEILLASRIAKL